MFALFHVDALIQLSLVEWDVGAGVSTRAQSPAMVSLAAGVDGAGSDAQDDDDGYGHEGQAAADSHQDPQNGCHGNAVAAEAK